MEFSRFVFPVLACAALGFGFAGHAAHAAADDSSWSVQLTSARTTGPFAAGIGSALDLNVAGQSGPADPDLFLGRFLNGDGSLNSWLVLDQATRTVDYIPATQLSADISGLQNAFKLYEQEGGTCTGYAVFDFLMQTQFSEFIGNGKLRSDLSTEEGRTELLADAINQYYLVAQHQASILGILDQYGKNYGFKCERHLFSDTASAHDFLLNALKSALPVLLSFNVGPDMYPGPFALNKIGPTDGDSDDNRLWLPRKIGERAEGGHSLVPIGSFSDAGKDYVVLLDSDWDLPRVWDLSEALGGRTAIAEVEFYTCR